MNRLRALYLDAPFELEQGGDKNRSRFLWGALRHAFDADLLLVEPPGGAVAGRPAYRAFEPVLQLAASGGAGFQSRSVLAFGPAERAAFTDLLARERYAVVLGRFHAPWNLLRIALGHGSNPAVVMDLDMRSSRLVGLTWRQRRSWSNRWFLFERLKLERLERTLFRQPLLVFFSNPVERDAALGETPPARRRARLAVLPNVMPDTPPVAAPPERAILFFGSLNSSANIDAFRFVLDELVPRLEPDLRRHDVRIHVVGKNPPSWFAERLRASGTDRIHLVGGVESMERTLAGARFVILPLRVASGTRTRILEAAAQARAVVTTPLGAEGIDVGADALVHEDPGEFAEAVRRLLDDPALADTLGRRLRDRCLARYAPDRVAADLVLEMSDFTRTRLEPRR